MKTKHGALLLVIAAVAGLSLVGCPREPEPQVFTENLYERYVKSYDRLDPDNPLETWLYGSDGKLVEHAVFDYTPEYGVDVNVYSSNTPSPATLTAQLVYEIDDDGNITKGTLKDGDGAVITSYDVTYSPEGVWTDYLEKDGSGAVLEHRVAEYDTTVHTHYVRETYYSDEGTANKIEEYLCTWDEATWRYLQENRYIKLTADEGTETGGYERNVLYTFTWNSAGKMYLQSSYDEDSDFMGAILYTFEDGMTKSRSSLSHDGHVMLYRSYVYDEGLNLIEVSYYNYNAPAGEELVLREAYRTYPDTASANYRYEKALYVSDYAARSLDLAAPENMRGRLVRPAAAHFHRD